jgi:integrase
MVITKETVGKFIKDGVPEGRPHATLRAGNGLALRLLPTGSASWQFVYRLPGLGRAGTQKTVTLGKWPEVDVKKAAELAKVHTGKVAAGADPRADIREEKRRERAVIGKALEEYEEWLRHRRLRKVETMMSSLRRGLARWLQRDLADVTRRDFIGAIEGIERDGRPGAARDFRKFLRTFLSRQLSLGVITVDPLAGYRLPSATKDDAIEAEDHGKALNEGEILAVWRAADGSGSFGHLVQLGMLTGLRRSELAALRWDWIDLKELRITIPGEYMKNGREYALPITTGIARLLEMIPNRGAGLVFPSERRLGGATMLSGWSQLVARLRRDSGVDVSLHDLRRTYRSALADLGVREEIAEAMIAHRRPDLVARYNRAELWAQRRAAAEAYDGWVSQIVAPADTAENVVRIGARR